jgi:hypothetical protein
MNEVAVEHALTAFKKEGWNCAQSILRAFQQDRKISEVKIAEAEQFGGGQAEGGICGALYAALKVTETSPMRDRLRNAFVAKAGSDKCSDVKISCVECVRLAATLVVEHDASGPTKSAGISHRQ